MGTSLWERRPAARFRKQELAPMGRSYGCGDHCKNAQPRASTTKTLAMITPVRPYMLS